MKRNTTSSIVLATLVAGFASPSVAMGQAIDDGAPVVTLAEARRRAASVDPNAVAARGRIETASWQRRAAVADMITPNLTAGGNYTHFSEPFFNFGTGTISPNATSATIQASYTVLGAGKFGELKSSRASVESAEANETAVRFRTALETDAAYFAVLADRELSRVAAERLKRAEEQFGIARVRVLAVARARADRNLARAVRADRERAAGELMAQSYHGYLTSRAGIELALVGLAVSTENYRVQRARYREGATTILDLMEAQVALSESEATLVQARYSTRLALAQIEALLGRRIFPTPGTTSE